MHVIQAQLPVSIYKEGSKFIAYAPALDISTCGDSFEQTQKRFEELVRIFIEEAEKMGTLEQILINYGWKKVKKPEPKWVPPELIASMNQGVKLPCPA
jgi:soluble P-type ATPase